MLDADTGAGGTDLAGLTLEFGVGAFAYSTFTFPATVTQLPVLSDAGGLIHGAVAGAARVVGITLADSAHALTVSW